MASEWAARFGKQRRAADIALLRDLERQIARQEAMAPPPPPEPPSFPPPDGLISPDHDEDRPMNQLDKDLIRRAKRAPRKNELSEADRIAINLLWRDGVRIRVLTRLFKCAKNTIYSNCLTGEAKSYATRKAHEVNDLIEAMGADAAREKYLTPAMVEAVNDANRKLVASYVRKTR